MEKISIHWESGTLNKMIGLAFKVNYNISITNLRNMQRLIEQSDFSKYTNKPQIIKRVQFLKKALEAKINLSIDDEALMLDHCRPDVPDPVIDEICNNLERYKQLNPKEIRYINDMVEDRLQFGIFQTNMDDLKDILDKIENGEFQTYGQAVQLIQGWFKHYYAISNNVRTRSQTDEISFDDTKVKDKIKDILNRLSCTSSIIITGIQLLNELLSPGYRPEKLYMYLGMPGGFKSAMLLKSFLDCIRYNATSYRPKNPDLKPAALYVTLENTQDESFARAFNMLCRGDDVTNYDVNDIYDWMKESKVLRNPNMGGFIVYRPNMSIDVSDLRVMIDDCATRGYEICFLCVDYIGRIRSTIPSANTKEQLKNVTNELKTLAVDYFIPVLSAHQGNRVGLSVVNAGKREGEVDLGKKMDGEFVGDAIEVFQNVDMQIFLTLERRRSDGLLFLSFNRNKERYRPQSKLSYFSQPFDGDNEIRLVDDIMEFEPRGVQTLSTDMEEVDAELLLGQPNHHNNRYTISRVPATSKNTVKSTKGKSLVEDFVLTPL